MVNYEAARAICQMRGVTAAELYRPIAGALIPLNRLIPSLIHHAIPVLSLFLSSPKGTLKFAAIRTLAQLAQVNPAAVQSCNLDMEKLINDDNRSVATFAITTLLKVRSFSIPRPIAL